VKRTVIWHGGSVLLRGFPAPARLKQWAEKPLRTDLALRAADLLAALRNLA
jgi:hypothetical protein